MIIQWETIMKDDIKALILQLSKVTTEYGFESKYIGRAVSYLQLLLHLLETSNIEIQEKKDLGGDHG